MPIIVSHTLPLPSVFQPSARPTAVRSTVTARPQGDVRVVWAGRAPPATNASATQVASMEHAANRGSATARRAGGASSVTKTSTTAPITSPVPTGQPALTRVREATPALAGQDLVAPIVSWRPMNVTATLARTEAAAM